MVTASIITLLGLILMLLICGVAGVLLIRWAWQNRAWRWRTK